MDYPVKIYTMKLGELDYFVKHKAKLGDVAYCFTPHDEHHYFYIYKGPDDNPYWCMLQDNIVDKYIEEINKLKVTEPKMDKRCDNCKYFNSVGMSKILDSWCSHEKHSGVRVAAHTSCPEHEPKEVKTTPFDGMKFYLKDTNTGELSVKYICEDCSKEMLDAPDRWWLVLPVNDRHKRKPGYHFRCSECDKKKEGKI